MKTSILNKYTFFYLLYLYYLIGGSLPEGYAIIPAAYYYPETFIAKSLIWLFYILPVYFFIIEIWDLMLKRYKIALINFILVVILYVGYQLIARKVLKPYYEKQKVSKVQKTTYQKNQNLCVYKKELNG